MIWVFRVVEDTNELDYKVIELEDDPAFKREISAFQIVIMLPQSDALHKLLTKCTFKGKVRELLSNLTIGPTKMRENYDGSRDPYDHIATYINSSFGLRTSP